jgi:hypothetical protein
MKYKKVQYLEFWHVLAPFGQVYHKTTREDIRWYITVKPASKLDKQKVYIHREMCETKDKPPKKTKTNKQTNK